MQTWRVRAANAEAAVPPATEGVPRADPAPRGAHQPAPLVISEVPRLRNELATAEAKLSTANSKIDEFRRKDRGSRFELDLRRAPVPEALVQERAQREGERRAAQAGIAARQAGLQCLRCSPKPPPQNLGPKPLDGLAGERQRRVDGAGDRKGRGGTNGDRVGGSEACSRRGRGSVDCRGEEERKSRSAKTAAP